MCCWAFLKSKKHEVEHFHSLLPYCYMLENNSTLLIVIGGVILLVGDIPSYVVRKSMLQPLQAASVRSGCSLPDGKWENSHNLQNLTTPNASVGSLGIRYDSPGRRNDYHSNLD